MSPAIFGLPPNKAVQATVHDGASPAAAGAWALASGVHGSTGVLTSARGRSTENAPFRTTAMKPAARTFEAVAGIGLLFAAGLAASAEIKVMSSAGFFEPYRKLIPQFERTMGHKIDTIRGPSMGARP